jgi:XTP/dITP diphosphohydrolase
MVCLADDSGLEIDILNKAPGINSSRWGGKNHNFNKAINKVFREIDKKDKNWKLKKIKARFICALTIYWPSGNLITSVGKVEGYISNKKKGKNGFGYDPIFKPLKEKLTFGEMKSKDKYKMDHRCKAFKKIKKFF